MGHSASSASSIFALFRLNGALEVYVIVVILSCFELTQLCHCHMLVKSEQAKRLHGFTMFFY